MTEKKKSFIITIDTEGDNLWGWKEGNPLKTENVNYLPRFQEICNKYNFIPTWLCNWEMVQDERFVAFALDNLEKGKCEIGMHLHAWNTPPYYELPRGVNSGLPYLIEYPVDIMRKKIIEMTNLIEEKFGKKPVVHRSGRWGMNDDYFVILHEQGYIADCSITPYVNWASSVGQSPGVSGPDYTKERPVISNRHGVLEIPVTTLWSEEKEKALWLRPNRKNLDEMLYLIEQYKNSDLDYLMFMIHSSELMPGGSPTFQTEGGIAILYEHLEIIFQEISKSYVGVGLEEYVRNLNYSE